MGRGTKPDMIATINTGPNQRQMRVLHLANSTSEERVASVGFRPSTRPTKKGILYNSSCYIL